MNNQFVSNSYFDIRSIPYANLDWIYADAKKDLLIVLGQTNITQTWIFIEQFRPPINDVVISFPMGAFSSRPINQLAEIAAKEAEGETGHKVLKIKPLFTFSRSPGLTNEKAHCFFALYDEALGRQNLHPDEEIDVIYVLNNQLEILINKWIKSQKILDSSVLLLMSNWVLNNSTFDN